MAIQDPARSLDLSGASDLDAVHRVGLNDIAVSLRRPFTELVQRLGAPHEDNIDWWVTPVASRNIFASALFLRCCYLLLAVRIVDSGTPVHEITLETPGLAAALRKALASRNPRVKVRARHGALRFRAGLFAGALYRLAAATFHAISQIVFSRVVARPKRSLPADPVTLIDTFVYRDSFDGAYRDRHYPGLLECLTEEERRRVFFVASYYKVRNYLRLFRGLRSSATRFLVKEDFLRLADYAYALGHPLRLPGLRVDACDFEGLTVGAVVNEALMESFAGSGSIEGLLRYRLARRLHDSGIAVALVVDWFENQEVDHGSNAGFRRYMPRTPVVGYQGFVVSRHYLSTFPTSQEMRLGLLPHRMAVMGSALVERAKAFCPEMPVGVAPAFRFAGLWRKGPPREAARQFRILVALPLMAKESASMLELMVSAARRFPAGDGRQPWQVRVKAHPSFAGSVSPAFEIVEGDFDDLLENCDVLVSAASSVCVQALAHGVPVVIPGSRNGITLNPIPEDVDREMWALCYTAEELTAALVGYAHRDSAAVSRQCAYGVGLRERLFSPVTRESVRDFIMPDARSGAASSPASSPASSLASSPAARRC